MKQPLRIHIQVKLADGRMLIEKEKVSTYHIYNIFSLRKICLNTGYKTFYTYI